jgi:hypothetical protein
MTQSEEPGGRPAFNVEALRRLKGLVLAEPRMLSMEAYATAYGESEAAEANEDVEGGRPPNDTTMCLAGLFYWSQLVEEDGLPPNAPLDSELIRELNNKAHDVAQAGLGLRPNEAMRLFYLPDCDGDTAWPAEYARDYEAARTPEERGRVTANRIEVFIVSRGKR